jgi:NADPH:quinone reductase-like Zn-dependent oxidoreductase
VIAITRIDFESGAALREMPTPEPGTNEVRIRVHASSLNPFDFFVANGLAKGMMEYEFPVTVGADFAGIVDKTGEDARRYSVGDEVFGFVFTPPTLKLGTWAEYLVVPEDRFVAAKPSKVSMLEAGALGIAATAALAAVDAIDPQAGETVLIVGATGGVGSYTVQLAAARGANVIATSKPEDEERLRRYGAAERIDYKSTDLAATVRERYPAGVKGLIDTVNQPDGLKTLAELVADGGHIATPAAQLETGEFAGRDITTTMVMAVPEPDRLARVAEQVDAGNLKVPIQSIHPLERALDAFQEKAQGTHGKLALAIVAQDDS